MDYRFVIAISWLSSSMVACGDDGSGSNQSSKGLAAPKFTYAPGPEGRAVGVRAIVEVDGVELKSDPVEVVLQPESAKRSTLTLNRGAGSAPKSPLGGRQLMQPLNSKRRINGVASVAQRSTACPTPGSIVDSLGTVNGSVCYLSVTTGAGTITTEKSHTSTLIFAREGLYGMRSTGGNTYVPPDFAHVSSMHGIGCVFGDQPDAISSEYLQSLESIGISYSLFFYALGYSVFTSPGHGLVRAMQFDSGYSLSASLMLIPMSFGMSVQITSSTIQAPTFLRAWNNDCGATVNTDNPIQYFRDNVEGLQQNNAQDTLEDSLTTEIAAGVLPILDSLGTPGAGGLADNVPAASNADMYAEFLSTPGADLPGTAVNTSMDGQLLDFKSTVGAAGDNTNSVVQAVGVNQQQVESSVPSLVGQAALQRDAEPGVAAATHLTTSFGDTATATKRFISRKIVHVDVDAGQKAQVTITAAEIADLIKYDAKDVVGATIVINAGSDIQDAAFTLSTDPLVLDLDLTKDSLLVQIDVDLTTAAGSFPADAATWVVRPAMRLIKVKAGKAATALLTAPTQVLSGAPASLNVQVVDAEGRLVKSDYKVRFVDASGAELGIANPKYGTGLFQYVPLPSVPAITKAEPAQLTYNGSSIVGLRITGSGFSKDSEVILGDTSTAVSSTLISVTSPETMLVVLPQGTGNGQSSVVIRNPGGQSSIAQSVTISGM